MTTPHPRDAAHRLVLLRHAKAEPAGGVADALRPLALAGRRQSTAVGAHLLAGGLVPEHVLVSSAVRTRQTWELVRGALADEPEPEVVVDDRLYDAGPGEVLELVRSVDVRVRTLLVVGHEPTMSAVASLLAGPQGEAAAVAQVRSGLPTGAFALVTTDAWATVEETARLVEVVRPA